MTPLAATWQRRSVFVPGIAGLLLALMPLASTAVGSRVVLVVDNSPDKPFQHGMEKLKLALQKKGVSLETAVSIRAANGDAVVVAGLASGPGEAARLISELRLTPHTEPESLLIRKFNRDGKTIWTTISCQGLSRAGTFCEP